MAFLLYDCYITAEAEAGGFLVNNQPIVNAWNEWDELLRTANLGGEEVVVGIADYANFEPTEPGSHLP